MMHLAAGLVRRSISQIGSYGLCFWIIHQELYDGCRQETGIVLVQKVVRERILVRKPVSDSDWIEQLICQWSVSICQRIYGHMRVRRCRADEVSG